MSKLFRDDVLLSIYRKQGMTEEQAIATLARVRAIPDDPYITPPCIENADDDSYFANCKGGRWT